MRWSFIAFSCASLITAGSLNAQMTTQNPPMGPNQHVIQRNAAGRTPAEMQQFQNALRARALRSQGAAPAVDMNNRNPFRQIVPGDLQNQVQNQDGQNQDGQIFDHGGEMSPGSSDALLGGGAYSAGGGGGVISIEQGRLMGIADGLRGLGQFNKDTATANVLTQDAHKKAIDNRHQQVKDYFEIKQLNRDYQNASRGPQPTHEDVLRYSQSALPERLSAMALDRDSGVIHWPAALMRPEFSEHRARLEQIFQGRSYYNSGVASESYLEIQDETARMLATLQDFVRETEPTAYVQARKFIAGLGYEGRFPAGHERVAVGR